MSLNLNIMAWGERVVSSTNKHGKPVHKIDRCYKALIMQTPTDASLKIMESPNPVQAYIEYVKSRSEIVKRPVYDFGVKDPVGYEDYNQTDTHIEEIECWLKYMKEEGYTLKFETM